MNKIALITGATSGIGWSTALVLGKSGYDLILCGRRTNRLNELSSQLAGDCRAYLLSFDVRDRDAVFEVLGSLPEEWTNIDVLINNAGNAHGLSSIEDGNLDDWDAMIDGNVKGLLYVSRAVIPGMVERREGHIINIGSIAGKEVYPNGNVYCGSKFAVDAINNSMRIDLNKHGIKVSQVCPGLVETEFSLVRFKGDEDRSKTVYEGFEALTAQDVAEIIEFIVTRPKRVNLSDTTILPLAQANATVLNRGS